MSNKEKECYICKRTETDVEEFLLSNLDNITKRFDMEIVNLKSKFQNIHNPKIEKINKEREIHLQTLEQQKKAIKNLKHHEIFREVQSSTEYLEYKVKIHDGWGKNPDGNSHVSSKTPFSVHVCAICGTLAWWESGNVSLRFYDDGIIRLKQIEDMESINPNSRFSVF